LFISVSACKAKAVSVSVIVIEDRFDLEMMRVLYKVTT
jgi:hypothetical protein